MKAELSGATGLMAEVFQFPLRSPELMDRLEIVAELRRICPEFDHLCQVDSNTPYRRRKASLEEGLQLARRRWRERQREQADQAARCHAPLPQQLHPSNSRGVS